MADWFVHRFMGFGSIIGGMYCLDTGWYWCGFGWIIVAIGLIFWSICDHEMSS